MSHSSPFRHLGWALLAALVCVAFPGCTRLPPLSPVSGTLRLGHQTLDHCLVTFLPEEGSQHGGHFAGVTDAQGRFTLQSAEQRPGAATGWHRVTVVDLSASTGSRRRDRGSIDEGADENESVEPRPSRVDARFSAAALSPLRIEVKPGSPPIDIDLAAAVR
jgi:hypothetical protein